MTFGISTFFLTFPVQQDEHFLTVCRYVGRNALRSGLVDRAEADSNAVRPGIDVRPEGPPKEARGVTNKCTYPLWSSHLHVR